MKLNDLIKELENIKKPIKLKFSFGVICDPIKFIENHVSILKANPGNKRFFPYYNRLLEFYQANK
jgi:hypothetical protein